MTDNTAIAILTATTDGGIPTVSARDLHKALEIKTPFATWIKRAIKAQGFVEDKDFLLSNFGKQTRGGHNRIEYHLTMKTARWIVTASNSELSAIVRDHIDEMIEIAHRRAADEVKISTRRMIARLAGTPTNKSFNAVLTESREREGKKTLGYHHANEARMVDSIVLGRDSYAVKRELGLKKGETVRDRMDDRQLRVLKMLEEHNRNLLQGAMDLEGWSITRESRKRQLQFLHDTLTLMR